MNNNDNNIGDVLPAHDNGPLDLSQLYYAVSSTGYEFAYFVLPPRLWCASPEEMPRPATAPAPPKPPEDKRADYQASSQRQRAHTL